MKRDKKKGVNRAERRKGVQAKRVGTREDISNVVALFGQPLYKEFVEEDEDCDRVHDCVCLLWNFALLKNESPAKDHLEMESLLIMALGLPPFNLDPDEALSTLDLMCERGAVIFPEYRYKIVEHWIDDHDANQIVYVAIGLEVSQMRSHLPPQPEEAEAVDGSKVTS